MTWGRRTTTAPEHDRFSSNYKKNTSLGKLSLWNHPEKHKSYKKKLKNSAKNVLIQVRLSFLLTDQGPHSVLHRFSQHLKAFQANLFGHQPCLVSLKRKRKVFPMISSSLKRGSQVPNMSPPGYNKNAVSMTKQPQYEQRPAQIVIWLVIKRDIAKTLLVLELFSATSKVHTQKLNLRPLLHGSGQ